ncbi:MAG: TlyA family RNA methyltransferase [Bilifractor sp.]
MYISIGGRKVAKKRLDVLVTEKGLAASREKAKVLIMAGEVFVDGQREDKPGMTFPETAEIVLKGRDLFPFVSRGGLKLDKAVHSFHLHLAGRVCMDVGASTGGFTDCMLQNGAVKVYSVDVGRGQLDWKLREDPRVVVMEKTNIRYVTPEDIQERPSFVSIDVSFISLTKVLPPVKALMEDEGELVCLIKPQFEAGREKVGKKGVVRDPAVHAEVIRKVISFAESLQLVPVELDFSPIKGPEGNIEYLLHLIRHAGSCHDNHDKSSGKPDGIQQGSSEQDDTREDGAKAAGISEDSRITEETILKTVADAHSALDRKTE